MFTSVLVGLALLAVGLAVGRRFLAPAPAPKRFGLPEVEAALKYVGEDVAAVRPIKGVVCGVLGYTDVVTADVDEAIGAIATDTADHNAEISGNEATIAELNAEIARLRGLLNGGAQRTEQLKELARVWAA